MSTVPIYALLVNLNHPGSYVQWSIFTISEANLVVVAIMVAIFVAALVIPFPKHGATNEVASARKVVHRSTGEQHLEVGDDETDFDLWTSRVRRRVLAVLPPGKLLPDRQPAYVASWVYLFGVASLVAFAMAVVTGLLIALGGTDWWHVNPIGHFFNSAHMWSVELFMGFMVIHLWGKFWMAAWRGRRTATWVTGVIAFVASVVECFTGYLSQQNFDSQWISTNGKDAINATGLGSVFNLMNFGQMLLWHVVLLPIVLAVLIGLHVLLVRIRGVSHPLPERRPRDKDALRMSKEADAADWEGPTRRYDIIKEATLAMLIIFALVGVLSFLLSSPDTPPLTIATWAKSDPADFLATAAKELSNTSETGTYGPPYNHGTSNVQRLAFSWQELVGVTEPINPAQTFVLSVLAKVAPTDPTLAHALNSYRSAPVALRQSWDARYLEALKRVSSSSNQVPAKIGHGDGPVPILLSSELTLARSGALDASLISNSSFYGTNFTKPLLFLEDGTYFLRQAQAAHLTGTQWGMMNETGSYPGQPWLWAYTLWYQVPGFATSKNVDLIAIYLTGVATMLLMAAPAIPGLRDVPQILPIHRLIWREWYRRERDTSSEVSRSEGDREV